MLEDVFRACAWDGGKCDAAILQNKDLICLSFIEKGQWGSLLNVVGDVLYDECRRLFDRSLRPFTMFCFMSERTKARILSLLMCIKRNRTKKRLRRNI